MKLDFFPPFTIKSETDDSCGHTECTLHVLSPSPINKKRRVEEIQSKYTIYGNGTGGSLEISWTI